MARKFKTLILGDTRARSCWRYSVAGAGRRLELQRAKANWSQSGVSSERVGQQLYLAVALNLPDAL